jgi:branched-chain amino acid transport system substrate-binding protein
MSRNVRIMLSAIASVAILLTGCGSSSKSGGGSSGGTTTGGGAPSGNTSSDTGVSASTIKVGYITSLTGVASSSYIGADGGARARFDLQNAEGGVNGRKIELVPVDDQSTPAQFLTGVHDLVQNKGVFGILPISSFTFAGASYLNQQGIPVVGSAFDGPEWGQKVYSNMFSFVPPFSTSFSGSNYDYDYYGTFLKKIGVTKLAGVAYGVSPSSQEAIRAIFASAATAGVQNCYSNYSVPFGAVDFTAVGLAIKSKGCDGTVGGLVDSSNVALSSVERSLGSNSKLWFLQGYDQQTLDSASARSTLNGSYVSTSVIFDRANPAVATMLDALQKYAGYRPGSIPNFGTWTSYAAADLFIKGLEMAGKNPTRKSFISNLHTVTSYDANGLLGISLDYAKFGTPDMFPLTGCSYFVQLQGDKFVPAVNGNGKVCGNRIKF